MEVGLERPPLLLALRALEPCRRTGGEHLCSGWKAILLLTLGVSLLLAAAMEVVFKLEWRHPLMAIVSSPATFSRDLPHLGGYVGYLSSSAPVHATAMVGSIACPRPLQTSDRCSSSGAVWWSIPTAETEPRRSGPEARPRASMQPTSAATVNSTKSISSSVLPFDGSNLTKRFVMCQHNVVLKLEKAS